MSVAQKGKKRSSSKPAGRSVKLDGPHAKATKILRRIEPRESLVEQVVSRLRTGIYEGEFPAGSELPAEGKLAELAGVSYTVIREAMRTLRSQGLVEISQGRRPRVKPAGTEAVRETLDAMLRRSGSSICELTELRRPIEYEMAALAAERATPSQLEHIEQAFARQVAAKTLDEQIESDIEFHNQLAVASGNPLFRMVLSILWDLLWESRRRGILRNGPTSSFPAHREIIAAVRRRDAEAARQAMQQHLTGFESLWQESNDGDTP